MTVELITIVNSEVVQLPAAMPVAGDDLFAPLVGRLGSAEVQMPNASSAVRHLDVGTPAGLCSSFVALTSQRAVLIRFTVERALTVNTMIMGGDTTASATLTTARMGLAAVGEDGQAWPLSRSANDPTLFGVVQVLNSKAFSNAGGWPASVTLYPGRVYAACVLLDGVTMPTVVAAPALRTSVQQIHNARRSGAATDFLGNYPVADASILQVPWARLAEGGTTNLARTCVLLGDSFFGSFPTWFGFGNAQGNARLHPLKNAGVGGEDLAQMLARWSTDVAAYDPEWVVLDGGINDVYTTSQTAATVIARYDAIIAQARAEGRKLLICTIGGNTGSTAPQRAVGAAVRTYVLGLGATDVKIADVGLVLTTGDGVTADATKLVDTVHPNATGITLMAAVIDDVIATIG